MADDSGESPPCLTDPNALAAIVHGLGGTVDTESRTFQFSLPLSEVKTAIPKIATLTNLGCRRVEGNDYIEQSASGPRTIIKLELFNKEQTPKETPSLLDLMSW